MPQIKSAIKRVKTSKKSYLRNTAFKSKIKSSIKKFNLALSENNENETNKYFKESVSILDKAVTKGILPKNTSSRKKSRLAKKLSTLKKSEQIKESTPAVPKKAIETQEKPVDKKLKVAKVAKKPVTKKPLVSKKKTETKKTVKVVKKPATKKPATKKTK